MPTFDLRSRVRASGLHLLISALIAASAAALVLGVWYPGIYRHVAGGLGLFVLITSVDLVLGPLLTLAVFDTRKTRRHLAMDLIVIAAIQLAALLYGLHTVFAARPIASVFEGDRFRVVTAAQVDVADLPRAPAEYRELPLSGPLLLSVRVPAAGEESNEALFKALGGLDWSQRPRFWQSYELRRAEAARKARPISILFARYPAVREAAMARLAELHLLDSDARFLPLSGARKGDWVVVLDAQGTPVHHLPVDGFF
ncbi:MAG: pilus assembly protein [Rhizobacter sp.]|nr:pilus assembly protein [Rhizobacter sp.]